MGATQLTGKEIKDNSILENDILLSDNTTLDVSITKHGLVPKAPNDTTKYLRGDASWATPTNGRVNWQLR